MPRMHDNIFDNGLVALKAAADRIYLCSQEPTTYTEATSTYALGNKTLTAGGVFPGAIGAGSPSGRAVATLAVTDGTITANGTATHDAVVSSGASRLETAQALSASQAVSSGNVFTKTAQTVTLRGLT